MGYGVIIFGDFTLDSRSVGAWRKTKLDATELAKGDLAMSKEIVFIKDDEATVEKLLARLPDGPLEFVRIDAKDSRMVVRGSIDEDLYRDIGPEIAALAVAVGAVGGHGELFVTSREENFLVTVSVDGARVAARCVSGYKNPKGGKAVVAARKSAGYGDVIAAIERGLVQVRGPRPVPRAAGTLDEASALLHRECVARLGLVSERALMKVAKVDHSVAVRPGMPAIPNARGGHVGLDVFPTKDALLAYLAHPFVPCANAALSLCATFDPDLAETLAVAHASRPIDDDLADGIARALTSRSSAASLVAILALLGAAASRHAYAYARRVNQVLATSRNEHAGARALELLVKHRKTDTPSVQALIRAVGSLRCAEARPLLKALSKKAEFKRDALIAIQTIAKGDRATGVHYGPRGGLIANKRKPKARSALAGNPAAGHSRTVH